MSPIRLAMALALGFAAAVAALALLVPDDGGDRPADAGAEAAHPGGADRGSTHGGGNSALGSGGGRTGDAGRAQKGAESTARERELARRRRVQSRIRWRRSRVEGNVNAGRLIDGVKLPPEGVHFLTWDPVRWTKPNPPGRRHGTDRLLRTILAVARDHRRAHPRAPRIAVGDISRPRGGSFGASFGAPLEFGRDRGGLGHVSHQAGLDVDVYYPRRDRRERAPDSLGDIDFRRSQDLVDRFVAAGAEYVFVGPRTSLRGPPGVVQPLVRHDDHLHVRLPAQ